MRISRDGHDFYYDISVDEFLCVHCLKTDNATGLCQPGKTIAPKLSLTKLLKDHRSLYQQWLNGRFPKVEGK